jgi:hypothetical protein
VSVFVIETGWYFWDETGMEVGPWISEDAAKRAEILYGRYLNEGPSAEMEKELVPLRAANWAKVNNVEGECNGKV